MLALRRTSRGCDKFCELSSATLAFRGFEVSDIDVRPLAKLLPLAFQLKRRDPAHQDAADHKESGPLLITTLVHVRIHIPFLRWGVSGMCLRRLALLTTTSERGKLPVCRPSSVPRPSPSLSPVLVPK